MVCAIAVLLLTALFIVLSYAHRVMKRESSINVNQLLEYTIQHIDNVLLSVEQSAGNTYWDMLLHMDDMERMHVYARKLVETNPYIAGCAIAMEPGFYKNTDGPFMAYYYKRALPSGGTGIVQADSWGRLPIEESEWYTRPMTTGKPCWIDPVKETHAENEAVTTFCLPIYNREGRVVGVMAADVSTLLLSSIIQSAKPTPSSYAVLMGGGGSFIVYPDSSMLLHQHKIAMKHQQADSTVREAQRAMAAGESGYRRIRLGDGYSYVFFKPFCLKDVPGRPVRELGWSAGVIFAEADIKGGYWHMRDTVISVAIVGLLLLLLLCRIITHRQLLPLRMLTRSAQRIAEGHYDEPIPESRQQDEVGTLQKHFRRMQLALADNISEMERLTASLQKDGAELEQAYQLAKEADRVKTSVLHKMSNRMSTPVEAIHDDVEALCQHRATMDEQATQQRVDDIDRQSKEVITLLDRLLSESQT